MGSTNSCSSLTAGTKGVEATSYEHAGEVLTSNAEPRNDPFCKGATAQPAGPIDVGCFDHMSRSQETMTQPLESAMRVCQKPRPGMSDEVLQNQSLLRAARDGDAEGVRNALARGAFLETRRPFVVRPKGSGRPDKDDLPDAKGLTPLMHAAQQGHAEVVRILLENGALVNAFEEDGCRAVHFAADAEALDCFELLLEAGADPDVRDVDGKTFLEHLSSAEDRKAWMAALGKMAPARPG